MSSVLRYAAAAAVLGLWAVPPASNARTLPRAARRTVSHRLVIPRRARQLIVVSSRTRDPAAPGYLATLRAYARTDGHSPWHRVLGAWRAETGSGHLVSIGRRREGDHATPIGVFGFGERIYGVKPRPRGLHYPYHRLRCGDWWDEDPFTRNYNRFVHAPCGYVPAFARWSETLWTETVPYPYFAVITFNMHPIVGGHRAPGSGIFLHSWVGGPTEGCVAVHERRLLTLLRWLRPKRHPVIEIGPRAVLST